MRVCFIRNLLALLVVVAVVGSDYGSGLAAQPVSGSAERDASATKDRTKAQALQGSMRASTRSTLESRNPSTEGSTCGPVRRADSAAPLRQDIVTLPDAPGTNLLLRDPLDLLPLRNMRPLYTSPRLPREGVWESAYTPRYPSGKPVIYKTFYRPSVQFPNAVVYMMVLDMSALEMKYYVGSQEPGASLAFSQVEPKLKSRVVAITNAMWMQRHSRGAGAIFRGKVIYPMVNGMATLIVYKDGSVDIREWSADVPIRLVQDARQLRHLIVKDGMVVRSMVRDGEIQDAEIGLGFLLGGGGRNLDGKHAWFVAHRSGFGIREDGNLVFAVGHHVATKDLAKALVLAGCVRGIHGDANPANIVGNLYLRDVPGNFLQKIKLSPEQSKYTLKRYEDGYTKDFFGFFFRDKSRYGRVKSPKRSNGRARQG